MTTLKSYYGSGLYRSDDVNETSIRDLASAVISQAYKDLVWAYKVLDKEEEQGPTKQHSMAVRFKSECEWFFLHDGLAKNFAGESVVNKAKDDAKNRRTFVYDSL